MRKLFLILMLLTTVTCSTIAQSAIHGHIRIVDSLSKEEQQSRNPVLLRSELDSMITAWNTAHPPLVVREPAPEVRYVVSPLQTSMLALIIVLILGLFFIIYLQRKRPVGSDVSREASGKPVDMQPDPNQSKKHIPVEKKIAKLDDELKKLVSENAGLQRVIVEYNGIEKEYRTLKQSIERNYKVRNYPGNTTSVSDHAAMQGVLATEHAVAAFAYEKFLKPVLAIADANKNSPSRINAGDRERLVELLISLSLLYIEYLYLRVNDLSIGGQMVERIQGLTKGKTPNEALLKTLSKEMGSRALVIRMALEKAGINKLSYPVFDETNLNN